ncbi:MAG TPA: hypothetical protein VF678_13750 [bacterium]
MNKKRVLLAGLAAGVFWIVVDFGIHGVILSKTYEPLVASGVINGPPNWFLPAVVLANLWIGLTLAFLYAALRGPLGAGPATALKIGFCVFIFYIPVFVTQVSFYKLGALVNTWSLAGGVVQTLGASLIAGWLYKE